MEIWDDARKTLPGIFDKAYWQGKLMEWVTKDPAFKVDLFRFIDVLPVLKTNQQVAHHIQEYFHDGSKLPRPLQMIMAFATSKVGLHLASGALKSNIIQMAKTFIAGQDILDTEKKLLKLHEEGYFTTLDLLGEATISEADALSYQKKYLDLIVNLERIFKDKSHPDFNQTPLKNISLKISAFDPHIRPSDFNGSVKRLKSKILPIMLEARQNKVFVNFDLEQWKYHSILYRLLEEFFKEPQLKDWDGIGVVLQAYLKCSGEDLGLLTSLASKRDCPLTIRLVKGAYWDYEVIQSRQNNHACPVFMSKQDTDANYELLTKRLLKERDLLRPAFASHNIRSLSHALLTARDMGLEKSAVEIQMLYGMAEPIRRQLYLKGYPVRIYTPVGAFLPGIGYLVRRLLENTSNSGFLKLSFQEGVNIKSLLKQPLLNDQIPFIPLNELGSDSRVERLLKLKSAFSNCPLTDFTVDRQKIEFEAAMSGIKEKLPIEAGSFVGGKELKKGKPKLKYSPSQKEFLVTRSFEITAREAQKALQISMDAWPGWRDQPIKERALLLLKLSELLIKERYNLAALMVFETGKPWEEADADLAEAVDFCEYYARQAINELSPVKMGNKEGEENIQFYQGRGPSVIIAPWNFPLAILCGMTSAALVAGNPVLIKPSSNSVGIAYLFFKLILQAGFPKEIAHFLPGSGEKIGNFLVEHPLVAQIAFTGSEQVGLSIIEKAAKTSDNQPQVKRVVCEMGGKNAIVIDSDADLDEAIPAVIKSAFGYAGQKCSACSKVVVLKEAYPEFIKRLLEVINSLRIEPAHLPSSDMGPVIDETSRDRLMRLIDNPGKGLKQLYRSTVPEGGHFVPATLFEVLDHNHPYLSMELFGPVLLVQKAKDFKEALALAQKSKYALTGAVFSRTPSHLEYAKTHFRVGNLYLNRGCTGAVVERQPFGGFKKSGIGTKAGGPGYLIHFADPRCYSENTMRKGFTPDLQV